ncbi:nitrate- and nitrite sensing domain-containing protein [Streptomyces sp. CO7]
MDAVTPTSAAARLRAARGGTGRKAPRSLRTRLLRVLILALAVLLALLGTAAAEQIATFRNASATADNARLEITLQGLVHELQKERSLTAGHLGGVREFRDRLPAQRKATDTALAVLDQALLGHTDERRADAVREALGRLGALGGIRAKADRRSVHVQEAFAYFTSTIAALDRLDLGLDEVRDHTLYDAGRALRFLGDAKELAGQERALLLGAVTAGRFPGDDHGRFLEMRAGRLASLAAFPSVASAAQERRLDAALSTPDARRSQWYERRAVRGGGLLDAAEIPPTAWWSSTTSTIDGLREVQVSLGHDVESRASELESDAGEDLVLFGLLALVTVAALGALALDCVRTVSGPLADLAQQAREVAGKRLPLAVAAIQNSNLREAPEPPEPLRVPAKAGAEVLEMAEAFDRVQRAAFDLATEQAVLRRNATESLVSLGRRNQNLVRRQLSFINKLEHEDADPATLANLFELDHLATRMRRNAESLLVLAGESSPRPWSTPLPVTDVLRAALSEVEEYRRVVLRRIEPAGVSGSVVAEIAHLLAELVENALNFSPPESQVEIEGRRTSAGYLIAIVDHGLGMDAQALAEANVRLSGRASFMADPGRFLGHFVVGALARKCGIEVRVGEAPTAGVVARVLLPAALLAEPKSPGTPDDDVVVDGRLDQKAVLPAPRAAAAAPAPAGSAHLVPVTADGRPVDSRPLDGRPLDGRVDGRPAHQTAGQPRQARPQIAAPPATGPGERRAEPARGADAARTRNGLVKRPRRSAIGAAVDETDRAGARPLPPAPERERTPEQVSGMLSSLRSAHLRGGISVQKEKERDMDRGTGADAWPAKDAAADGGEAK